jgi:hypothetical protein
MKLNLKTAGIVNPSGQLPNRFRRAAKILSYISPPRPFRRPESLLTGAPDMQIAKSAGILLLVIGVLAIILEAFS